MKQFLRLSSLFVFAIAITGSSWAQDRSVSGQVTSIEDGSTLPGVNVVIKGTTKGTITDFDGKYTLNVSDGAILVFSFIGYTSEEIEVGARSVINLQLSSDVTQLSEIVVTAVGIQREKKALGYGIENISGDQLQQISEPEAIRGLQGKIPGVYIQGSSGLPGSSTRVTIRGNSSLLGNNQPLYVVDGIPFSGGQSSTDSQLSNGASYSSRISDLDPNNIASMTVLKGGAAAALYGSRAANGVILITTKTGSRGASKKGLEVTLSTSYSVEKIANLPDYQNKYGAGVDFDYGNVNGSWGPAFDEQATIPHWFGNNPSFPQFTTVDANGNPVPIQTPYEAHPNNVKDFFQTGSVLENSVAISGGGEQGNMSMVISRTTQEGYIPTSEFNRTTLSLGGTSILDNGLVIGGNMSYTQTNQDGPIVSGNAIGATSISSRLLWLNRAWPLQDFDVFPHTDPVTGNNNFAIGADNPYWSIANNSYESQVDRFVGNMNFSYELFDWLSVSYKVGLNQYTDNRFQKVAAGSTGRGGIGEIINDRYYWQELDANLLVTLTKELNEDFDLTAIVGQNMNQRRSDNQTVTGTTIVTRGIVNLDNSANLVNPGDLGLSKRRLLGVFADVSVGYKDFLYLNLTGRNDWSSTLPVENRSFFYPAVSSSFVFTELFDISDDILNFGKIRASWSKVGNDATTYLIDPTFNVNPSFGSASGGATLITFPLNTSTAANVSGSTQGNILGNPNLTPEFTSEIELGTTLNFLNDRIGLDFTYYDRKTTDQIIQIKVPSGSGYISQVTNIGEVSNDGIEIGLDVTPLKLSNGLTWNIYGTFTKNNNKVVDIGDNDELIVGAGFGDPQVVLIPGEAYGAISGTYYLRDDNGNFLIDGFGNIIQSTDSKILGDPNPDFTVGITNSISFKGITLRAVFDWKEGGDLYSASVGALLGRGVTTDTENRDASIIINGVLGDANTGLPILASDGSTTPNNYSINSNSLWFNNYGLGAPAEGNTFDATVYRLREVSLGYKLPKNILAKTPFGSVEVSISGRNLWFFAPGFPEGTNFDPETNTFGATNFQGFEQRTYLPSSRRFGVNLKVTL